MRKLEIIRINISSSFMSRTRCAICGEGPDYYYAVRMPLKWKDVRNFLLFSQTLKKFLPLLIGNWYKEFTPRYFTKMDDFAVIFRDISYDTSLHKNRGINLASDDYVNEFVGCMCGNIIWAFNQKSVKNRPEITNRKGRYKYPQRFVY